MSEKSTAYDDQLPVEKLPLRLRKHLSFDSAPLNRWHALHAAGRDPESPCWLWDANKLSGDGYGQVKWRSKVWNTHRLVWHLLVEALPQPGKARKLDGRVLDHICETRRCCNPYHLDHISQSDNTKRGARHRA